MKKWFSFLICTFAYSAVVTAQPREVQCLDSGWLFHAVDVKDSEDADKTYPLLTFIDTSWREVNLPHDFQIEQPWVAPAADEKADNSDVAANIKSRLSARGFKEMGQGWYRLHLTLPDSLRQRRMVLDFGGIMYTGDVYLNGERIGGTDYGYVGFGIDVTENIIAVKADTREPNASRWYTGGGLFRNVRLISTSRDVFFERHPLFITTRDNRFVNISVEVTTRGRDKEMPVKVCILDPQGRQVGQTEAVVKRSTPTRTIEQQLPEIEIPDPQLWDTENPNLYTAKVTLCRKDGTVADTYRTVVRLEAQRQESAAERLCQPPLAGSLRSCRLARCHREAHRADEAVWHEPHTHQPLPLQP